MHFHYFSVELIPNFVLLPRRTDPKLFAFCRVCLSNLSAFVGEFANLLGLVGEFSKLSGLIGEVSNLPGFVRGFSDLLEIVRELPHRLEFVQEFSSRACEKFRFVRSTAENAATVHLVEACFELNGLRGSISSGISA